MKIGKKKKKIEFKIFVQMYGAPKRFSIQSAFNTIIFKK